MSEKKAKKEQTSEGLPRQQVGGKNQSIKGQILKIVHLLTALE